jgi:hypothetical protein
VYFIGNAPLAWMPLVPNGEAEEGHELLSCATWSHPSLDKLSDFCTRSLHAPAMIV